MQQIHSLGLHLILIPRKGSFLPTSAHDALARTVEHTTERHRLRCSAVHVREDHLHILLGLTDEADIADVIGSILADLRREMRSQGADMRMRTFEWDDAVHVTLLPPWHLEIMASFVRDQERYHETRTLEDELDEVFRPNGIATPGNEPTPLRAGASALHIH
jgi:REP element-mobilizing transposase RayT